jgi:hypothetical protein
MTKHTGDSIPEQVEYEKTMLDECYDGLQELAGREETGTLMFNVLAECFLLHAYALVNHLEIPELAHLPDDIRGHMFAIGLQRANPRPDWQITDIKRAIDERLS